MNTDKREFVMMRALSLETGRKPSERTLSDSAEVAFGSLGIVMAHVERSRDVRTT